MPQHHRPGNAPPSGSRQRRTARTHRSQRQKRLHAPGALRLLGMGTRSLHTLQKPQEKLRNIQTNRKPILRLTHARSTQPMEHHTDRNETNRAHHAANERTRRTIPLRLHTRPTARHKSKRQRQLPQPTNLVRTRRRRNSKKGQRRTRIPQHRKTITRTLQTDIHRNATNRRRPKRTIPKLTMLLATARTKHPPTARNLALVA